MNELLRLFEKFNDLGQLLFGLVGASHICKSNGGMFPAKHARATLAEGHGGIVAALRLAEDEPQHAAHQQHRQDVKSAAQQACPHRWGADFDVGFAKLLRSNTIIAKLFDQGGICLLARFVGGLFGPIDLHHADGIVAFNNNAPNLATLDHSRNLTDGERLLCNGVLLKEHVQHGANGND